jgi:hypothetical protein
MSDVTHSADELIRRLTRDEGTDRVFYALGTLLDAADFQDEQLYHRSRLALALSALCGAGTLAGLRVAFDGEDRDVANPAAQAADELTVAAGLAIDPFGRLIEVPRRQCIRLERWLSYYTHASRVALLRAPMHAVRAQAWLFVRFLACERGKTPVFAQGNFDATNAIAPARVRDGFELKLFLENDAAIPHVETSTRAALPSDPGDRLRALKDSILDGYGRSAERAADPGWLMLAKVEVPLLFGAAPDDVHYGVVTVPGDAPVIDNHLRSFAYPDWALAHFNDLPLPTI